MTQPTPVNPGGIDWDSARRVLESAEREYAAAMADNVTPLNEGAVLRSLRLLFDGGDRTPELYNMIMRLQ